MRASLILVACLVLARPAAADGDFAAILRALQDQFAHYSLPITDRGGAIETEAEGILRKSALPAIFADEHLGPIDKSSALNPVRDAMGEELAEIDPLLAVDAYVTAGGDPKRFLKTLSYLSVSHPIVWKAPEVRKAVERTCDTLAKLDKDSLTVSYANRYHGPRWTFDSAASWNPFKRRATLYVVGSSPLPGGRSKSFTADLVGSVVPRSTPPNAAHQHSFTIGLEDVQFHANSSEIELTGRWTHRFEPTTGTMVNLTNQLTLKIVDVGALGKLVQEVLITDPKGKVSSGRITYSMTGKVGAQGELSGTFEAAGESNALSWLDNPAPEKVRGTWQGKLDRSGAQGTLTLRGNNTYTVPWEAREQK